MGSMWMVGFGGALGAMARYAIGLIPVKGDFPVLTLLINVFGACLIGFIVGVSIQRQVDERWLLFWKTGICGGFTTFSTFSLEALTLLQNGKTGWAAAYAVASVLFCIGGVALGRYLAFRLFEA